MKKFIFALLAATALVACQEYKIPVGGQLAAVDSVALKQRLAAEEKARLDSVAAVEAARLEAQQAAEREAQAALAAQKAAAEAEAKAKAEAEARAIAEKLAADSARAAQEALALAEQEAENARLAAEEAARRAAEEEAMAKAAAESSTVTFRTESVTIVSDADQIKGSHLVIVGSFSKQDNATRLRDKLVQAGNPAAIARNQQGMYRVILSSHDSYDDARRAVLKARSTYPDAWVLVNE